MKFVLIVFFISICCASFANEPGNVCDKWDELDKKIVTLQIDKDEALELLEKYEKEIVKYFNSNNGKRVKREDWVFPLTGYTSVKHRDNGVDYRRSTYDYFQGSNSKGHPAHDIFILDDDKNLLDDSTGKPVEVVSMSSGVIAAVDTTWQPGSMLRGGKYVKVFDVTNMKIFYYSHLSQVNVKPGDIINAGDKIGEVGRTGRRTILPEGKTHLHVGLLSSEDGYPVPEEIIDDIFEAEREYELERKSE